MQLHPPSQTALRPKPGRGIHPAILFLALLCVTTGLRAQEAASAAIPAEAVYVVAHVDAIPPSAGAALALLKGYAAACRQVPGVRRFEVLREAGRPNHFTLLEVWENEAARQANEAAETTRRFRSQLYPLLGSPFDERLQQLVQP